MKKIVLSTFCITLHLIVAAQNFVVTEHEFAHLATEFSNYVSTVQSQITWFYRTPKFLRTKAAKAMGYNKRTISYLKNAYHGFSIKNITKQSVVHMCNTRKTEFIDYANTILDEIARTNIRNVNDVAFLIHKKTVFSFQNLTDTQAQLAINDAEKLIVYQKGGLINTDTYCTAIIKSLFVEFITSKRNISKRSIPGWLAELF